MSLDKATPPECLCDEYGKDLCSLHHEKTVVVPQLAEWEDADVQAIYEILCDNLERKPEEQHWEGYLARWIVGELIIPQRKCIAAMKAALEKLERVVIELYPGHVEPDDEHLEEYRAVWVSVMDARAALKQVGDRQ